MSHLNPSTVMIFLNLLMIAYTLWVLGLAGVSIRLRASLGGGAFLWLGCLHWGLSTHSLFPEAIPGPVFLGIIVAFVGLVGALFLLTPARVLMDRLDQEHLLLLQGIRVFFGGAFLMQAALGTLPQTFGILDGFTHITAGALGLWAAALHLGGRYGSTPVWVCNIFGLVDILIVASTLALVLLDTLTPHHNMMYAVFLPAPVWMLTHFVSIRRSLVSPGAHGTTPDQFVVSPDSKPSSKKLAGLVDVPSS